MAPRRKGVVESWSVGDSTNREVFVPLLGFAVFGKRFECLTGFSVGAEIHRL